MPTPTALAQSYEYMCQVGQATDSETGQACGDGYFGTTYEYQGGTWWPVKTYCMTHAECDKPIGPPLDEYSFLPCVPHLTPNGILIDCKPSGEIETWNVRAEVNTSCPINEVMRAPYPRALVNVDTNFILQPQEYNTEDGNPSAPQSPANLASFIDEEGNPTEHGYDLGVWKELRLIMRSRRFNGGEVWFSQVVPKPRWIFDDRAWNAGKYPATQYGPQAKYNYQTSSAGLTNLFGRAFDVANKTPMNLYNLPAYPVMLSTYCGHEWKVTLKMADRKWEKTGACYHTILYPDGSTYVPPGTSNEGCDPGFVATGKYVYSWTDAGTGWAGIDLTRIGRPTTYDVRTRTRSGGVFEDHQYWDEPVGIWVPVLEVQSVMRGGCVASGACEPPRAEPNSITH